MAVRGSGSCRLRRFQSLAGARRLIGGFIVRYNAEWLIQGGNPWQTIAPLPSPMWSGWPRCQDGDQQGQDDERVRPAQRESDPHTRMFWETRGPPQERDYKSLKFKHESARPKG